MKNEPNLIFFYQNQNDPENLTDTDTADSLITVIIPAGKKISFDFDISEPNSMLRLHKIHTNNFVEHTVLFGVSKTIFVLLSICITHFHVYLLTCIPQFGYVRVLQRILIYLMYLISI